MCFVKQGQLNEKDSLIADGKPVATKKMVKR